MSQRRGDIGPAADAAAGVQCGRELGGSGLCPQICSVFGEAVGPGRVRTVITRCSRDA